MQPSCHPASRSEPAGAAAAPGASPDAVIDFANTVACEACRTSDGLAAPEDFVRWSQAHAALSRLPVSEVVLHDLRGLRRDLREMFENHVEGTPPRPVLLRRLNRWLGSSPTHLRAAFSKGGWRFEEVAESMRPGQRWEREMALAAVSLLAGPHAERIRKCEAPGCEHFLLSRTRGQRWCSPTGCGNRVRVARHYRRRAREARARSASRPRRVVTGRLGSSSNE